MIQFRNAQAKDDKAIAQLHANSWKVAYRGVLSDAYLDNEVEQDRLATWQQRLKEPAPNQVIVLAEDAGKLVGFVCIYLNDDPAFGSLVDNLHVAPGLLKSGIGRKLLQEAAHVIEGKAKTKRMYLWVFEKNENAIQFYNRVGGTNYEVVQKESFDGQLSNICRYVWEDVSVLK